MQGLRKGWKFVTEAVDPQAGRGDEFMRRAAAARAAPQGTPYVDGMPQAQMPPNPAQKMGGFKNWAVNHSLGSVQAAKDYGRSVLDDAATLAKGGGRLAAAGRLVGKVAAPVGVISSAADIIGEQNNKTAADFANESGHLTEYDPNAEQSLYNDVVLGSTERGLGALRTFGKQFIPNSWTEASSTPLPDLPLDPATAARGKALANSPAARAQQHAAALAHGQAADPGGSYARAEAARLSSQKAPVPDQKALEQQAMDPTKTEADRIKAVAEQYGTDPKNVTFRQMGPDGVFKVGKNAFTDGSDPNASRISNMNEPWTPEKAATLERVGQMERYNNYLRAGYDPATAQRLMEGKSAQENQVAVIGDPRQKSFRDVAMDMLERSTRMQYGGNMRDAAMDLMGLQQKEDQANAANATEMAKVNAERETGLAKARAGTKEPVSFRDMLAVQQFGLDKQKFDYQQKKDEAEFNRGVAKDQASMSQAQREASAKAHGERMAAAFNDPKTGKVNQEAVAEFNRRAAPAAAKLFKKNIDQLDDHEFAQMTALQRMHDLVKNNAGMLRNYGKYADNPDLSAYMPKMNKQGQYDITEDRRFLKLQGGGEINIADLMTHEGNQWWNIFQTKVSPRTYGVDPNKLPK